MSLLLNTHQHSVMYWFIHLFIDFILIQMVSLLTETLVLWYLQIVFCLILWCGSEFWVLLNGFLTLRWTSTASCWTGFKLHFMCFSGDAETVWSFWHAALMQWFKVWDVQKHDVTLGEMILLPWEESLHDVFRERNGSNQTSVAAAGLTTSWPIRAIQSEQLWLVRCSDWSDVFMSRPPPRMMPEIFSSLLCSCRRRSFGHNGRENAASVTCNSSPAKKERKRKPEATE